MHINQETERLYIRPIQLSDADFIVELVNCETWRTYIGERNVSSKAEGEKYIQGIIDDEQTHYNIFQLKETRDTIGVLTLIKRSNERFPDIGFALLPAFENKGYAFEACKAYLQELQKSNKYENLIAFTTPDNVKSIRLLQKLGLKHVINTEIGNANMSYFALKEFTGM